MNYKVSVDEIKTALNLFADEHWGLERAQTSVSLSCNRLMVNISIIDANGKLDCSPHLLNMTEEMREPLRELENLMFSFVPKESDYLSINGNHITLEYWDVN